VSLLLSVSLLGLCKHISLICNGINCGREKFYETGHWCSQSATFVRTSNNDSRFPRFRSAASAIRIRSFRTVKEESDPEERGCRIQESSPEQIRSKCLKRNLVRI